MAELAYTDAPCSALSATAAKDPTIQAGFWRRLMAASIDGMLVLALVVGISIATGVTVGQVDGDVMVTQYGRRTPLSAMAKPHVVTMRDGPQFTTVETTSVTLGLQTIHSVVTRKSSDQSGRVQPGTFTNTNISSRPSALALVLLSAIWLLYASVLESSRWQATLGKRAMFIRVSNDEGVRVSFLRALARNALKPITVVPGCIGYLMSGWTAKKQALHDILAKCTVEVTLR